MALIFSSVLFGLGDVIAQVVFGEKEAAFDFKRTGRAWFFGTFLLGPLAHWHFNFLEWLVVRKVPKHIPPLRSGLYQLCLTPLRKHMYLNRKKRGSGACS